GGTPDRSAGVVTRHVGIAAVVVGRDGIGGPQDLPGRGVQGHDLAAERAALVAGLVDEVLLVGGDALVGDAVVDGRRAGDARRGVAVDGYRPQRLAGRAVHGEPVRARADAVAIPAVSGDQLVAVDGRAVPGDVAGDARIAGYRVGPDHLPGGGHRPQLA